MAASLEVFLLIDDQLCTNEEKRGGQCVFNTLKELCECCCFRFKSANLAFGGCRDPNRECISAYSREEVNCNCIGSCVSVAFPLTLNALVPGCCCLVAGFW